MKDLVKDLFDLIVSQPVFSGVREGDLVKFSEHSPEELGGSVKRWYKGVISKATDRAVTVSYYNHQAGCMDEREITINEVTERKAFVFVIKDNF